MWGARAFERSALGRSIKIEDLRFSNLSKPPPSPLESYAKPWYSSGLVVSMSVSVAKVVERSVPSDVYAEEETYEDDFTTSAKLLFMEAQSPPVNKRKLQLLRKKTERRAKKSSKKSTAQVPGGDEGEDEYGDVVREDVFTLDKYLGGMEAKAGAQGRGDRAPTEKEESALKVLKRRIKACCAMRMSLLKELHGTQSDAFAKTLSSRLAKQTKVLSKLRKSVKVQSGPVVDKQRLIISIKTHMYDFELSDHNHDKNQAQLLTFRYEERITELQEEITAHKTLIFELQEANSLGRDAKKRDKSPAKKMARSAHRSHTLSSDEAKEIKQKIASGMKRTQSQQRSPFTKEKQSTFSRGKQGKRRSMQESRSHSELLSPATMATRLLAPRPKDYEYRPSDSRQANYARQNKKTTEAIKRSGSQTKLKAPSIRTS
jgi:hypothetical protein